jgi:tRNA A-37 threonylcarbamoyl transferase component Bud32
MLWTKTLVKDSGEQEIELQKISAELGLSPKIISVVEKRDRFVVKMERVMGSTLSDLYGDDHKDIPTWIWEEIRYIILELRDNGIEYIDITPYNFMEVDDNIKVIDFGDAKKCDGELNWFVDEFINGLNEWNPDFK